MNTSFTPEQLLLAEILHDDNDLLGELLGERTAAALAALTIEELLPWAAEMSDDEADVVKRSAPLTVAAHRLRASEKHLRDALSTVTPTAGSSIVSSVCSSPSDDIPFVMDAESAEPVLAALLPAAREWVADIDAGASWALGEYSERSNALADCD